MRLFLLMIPFVSTAMGATCEKGYCCNGSVIMKKHNNDFSPSNFWCCEGDTNSALQGDTGPTTCTAGTQVPLTKAASGGGSSSTEAPGGIGSSSTSSGGVPMITNAPVLGAAVAAGHLLLAF